MTLSVLVHLNDECNDDFSPTETAFNFELLTNHEERLEDKRWAPTLAVQAIQSERRPLLEHQAAGSMNVCAEGGSTGKTRAPRFSSGNQIPIAARRRADGQIQLRSKYERPPRGPMLGSLRIANRTSAIA
jgi:hypothetical protein